MGVALSISITPNSQNVAANTTNVTVKVVASWTYGAYNLNQKPGWVKIDGTKYDFTNSFNNNRTTSGSKTICTKTVDVVHGATGAKTLAVSASYTTGVSAGTISASTSKTLTTIPRATTPTVSTASVDMGGKVTISTPRAAAEFTHDLAYSFAGGDYVTIATGVTTSYSWTTPDLASKIPSAVSGVATVRCTTKSGSTVIGTATATVTLKVPASVVPTVSNVSAVETVAGLAAQFGGFVRGKSKAEFTITAAGAKGSTIKSYSTKINTSTFTGATFTADVSWTNMLVTATVTDTRGRTATMDAEFSVLDYTKPTISHLSVLRVSERGEGDPNGTGMYVAMTYEAPSLGGKNTVSAVLECKRSVDDDSEWETLWSSSAWSGAAPMVPDVEISPDYQYDVRLTVTDWFKAAAVRSAVLPSGEVILDIGANGDCIGVGETAQYPGHFSTAWALRTAHGEIPRHALVLPETANLDTYKTPGYYVFAAASSSTITGLPFTTGSGSVEIYSEGEAGQIRQVVTRCSVDAREIWERLYYADSWHTWVAIYKGGTGRVLWSGSWWMTAAHTATLKERVSQQPNGIILVFSQFTDNTADNSSFHHRVIHKNWVALFPGHAECVQLTTSDLSLFATKYLYIHDDKIVGHDNNTKSGTGASGITYTNSRFVLRYVIGF